MISICITRSNFLSSSSSVCHTRARTHAHTHSFQSRTFREVSATPVSKTPVFASAGTFPTLPRKELTRSVALWSPRFRLWLQPGCVLCRGSSLCWGRSGRTAGTGQTVSHDIGMRDASSKDGGKLRGASGAQSDRCGRQMLRELRSRPAPPSRPHTRIPR